MGIFIIIIIFRWAVTLIISFIIIIIIITCLWSTECFFSSWFLWPHAGITPRDILKNTCIINGKSYLNPSKLRATVRKYRTLGGKNEIYYTFAQHLFHFLVYTTRNMTFVALLFWFMAYRTRNITVGVCLFCFMAYVAYYNKELIRSVSIKHTDRTNHNTPCPDVIMRRTLRMCSEYGLLAMLMVCTERTIRQLL